jgi:hypothetical protein
MDDVIEWFDIPAADQLDCFDAVGEADSFD